MNIYIYLHTEIRLKIRYATPSPNEIQLLRKMDCEMPSVKIATDLPFSRCCLTVGPGILSMDVGHQAYR